MTQLDALWELQKAEKVILDLNRTLRSTEARKRFSYLKSFLTEQQEIINNLEKALAERSAKIAAYSAQLKSFERSYDLERSELEIMEQDEGSTSEELDEARVDIEKLQDKVTALCGVLNELAHWAEKAYAEINSTWEKAVKAKREYSSVRAVCEEEKAKYKPQYDEAKQLIAEKKKLIKPELLKKYAAIKKNYPQPIAKPSNGRCGGCNMLLPSIVVRKVSAGSCVVECENCGRILIP